MLLIKGSVLSLKEKTTQPWFSYFQIACKYLKYFMTDALNIIYDDFDISVLGYIGPSSVDYVFHKGIIS